MAWPQQQSQQPRDFAAHFHLLPLIEAAADAVERGAMDQHMNELGGDIGNPTWTQILHVDLILMIERWQVNDLASRFESCQQLLNSITTSSNPKAMTLRWQKQQLAEHENQLNERREFLAKYKLLVEETVNST